MVRDLRYAVRTLFQHKGWTAVVVLSLAFGIGANTALFSAVNGAFLRTLGGVEDPGSLVRIRNYGPNDMSNGRWEYGFATEPGIGRANSTISYPLYEAMREANATLTDLLAGAPLNQVSVTVDGQAEIASAYLASGTYYDVLGVRPVLGRTFTEADDQRAADPVAVISEGFWNRRFGRDPAVVGTVIRVNDVPTTIVGVTPAAFTGIQRVVTTAPDVTVPLAFEARLAAGAAPGRLDTPTQWWVQVMGRLRPGVSPEQVRGNLEGVFQQAARANMDAFLNGLSAEERALSRNQDRTDVPRLVASSGARGLYDTGEVQVRSMAILGGVMLLILLIVCANVANLLLSRAAARQREIAVRLSMGATRLRLVRQLLTESVLLALLGAAGGVLVAFWGRRLLPAGAGEAPIDWRVLGFAAGLAVLTGVVFGILPALRATATDAGSALKEASRTVSARSLLGKSLLVAQIAISLVLLVGAGLFVRTVGNLQRVDVGFDTGNLVVFRLDPQLGGYDSARSQSLYEQLTRRLRAAPGVRDVSLSWPGLLSGMVNSTGLYRPGDLRDESADRDIHRLRVAPGFFGTMGIPLVAGRAIEARDADGGPKVAVINEAAVRKFFPGENPLGQTFGGAPEETGDIEIVGVVADAKYDELRDEAPPTMYVPYVQYPVGAMAIQVRTAGDPAQTMGAVRAAVQDVDPAMPLIGLTTQVDLVAERMELERFFAQASAAFGALALLVAAIGLFGLMSYSVARRTNEIGVRMALGADRETVVRMIMRESLVLVAVGGVLGAAGAVGAGRVIAAQLYGVAPVDPLSFGAALAVLAAVSALAGYLPARRASRVDPLAALQYE